MAEGAFKASFVIEAVSSSSHAVEQQIKILEDKLRKEPFKILRMDKSSVEELEGQYSAFLDFEVQTHSFRDLVYLVITYGPSSIELLEPSQVSLGLSDAQDVLTSVINAVHYYTGLILESQVRLKEFEQEKLKHSKAGDNKQKNDK